MSTEDRLEQSKSYKSFRTTLDVGMGVLYVLFGAFLIYAKYFGTMSLPDTYAYVLGSLMVVYGLFRLYRGLVVLLRKNDTTRSRI